MDELRLPDLLRADQLTAVELFEVRQDVINGRTRYRPAYGQRALRAMMGSQRTSDPIAFEKMLRDAGVNEKTAGWFRENRFMSRGGDGHLEILPRINGVGDDALENYEASPPGSVVGDVAVKDDRPVKYQLHQLFNDTTITDKLGLSSRRMQSIRRQACTDPTMAAASATEYIQDNGFPNSRVHAGVYTRSVKRLRNVLLQAYRDIVPRDNLVQAIFVGEEVMMTFDNFVPGTRVFTVRAPMIYSREAHIVYQLAVLYGPDVTMAMYGIETAYLRINIINDATGDYYNGVLKGYSSEDGIEPMADAAYPRDLTTDQLSALIVASRKVVPVMRAGCVVGSAVHVTDGGYVTAGHTLKLTEQPGKLALTVRDETVRQWSSLGSDLAMFRQSEVQGTASWALRDPDVGERVVVCYSVGEEMREYSEVLRIDSVSSDYLTMTESNVLRPGSSGGAIISLRDGALLGLFVSKQHHKVIGAVMDTAKLTKMMMSQPATPSIAPVSSSGDAPGDVIYRRMIKRGLKGYVDDAAESVLPLYVSTQLEPVGLLANVSGVWVTTVDPNIQQLYVRTAGSASGMPLQFNTGDNGLYVVVGDLKLRSPLPVVRYVEPGERVFVLTMSSDSVCLSDARMVTHTFADGMRFNMDFFGHGDVSLTGGLIVAERDAAVVGMYSSTAVDVYGERVSVGLPLARRAGVVNVANVVLHLSDRLSRSQLDAEGMQQLAHSVISVTAELDALRADSPVESVGARAVEVWYRSYDVLSVQLGLTATDYAKFSGMSRRQVTELVLAQLAVTHLQYVRDKLSNWYVDHVLTRTPIVGEFPFTRPLSVTGSTISRGTRDGDDRVRELEDRVNLLTGTLTRLVERGF